MKRILSMLLAALLVLAGLPFGALAEDDGLHPEELVVASPTAVTGNFFHEIFSSNSADMDVRSLIHGRSLVKWDAAQACYAFDPAVVIGAREMVDKAGNHSYYLVLSQDLCYNDGTPITAWDYAFSFLLLISPELREASGKGYDAEFLLGYSDYISGRFPCLTGVSVLNDYQLVITLSHRALPYFFECSLLQCTPYPIEAIAPGCRVYDDGYGVYLANADTSDPQKLFTADLLRRTLMDPDTGYNSHPSITSGPYVLTAFDGTTCHFRRNASYRGMNSGTVIEKIAFTVLDYASMAQQLADGQIHLVNKAAYGPAIMETMQSVGQTSVRFENYPRVGLSFVAFSRERPAVQDQAVRQAIAWCMDRDALARSYAQGFGMRVDGFFGIEQWEYLLVNQELDYPVEDLEDEEYDAAVAAWEELNLDGLTAYSADVEKANALLDAAQWTLDQNGGPYRPGKGSVRCRQIDGELVPLDLTMMVPEGNEIIPHLQEAFLANLSLCGIRLTLVEVPFPALLSSWYDGTAGAADLVFLATNFDSNVDPAIGVAAGESASNPIWEAVYSDDAELRSIALAMRQTEQGDLLDYVTKWIAFQQRFNEILPSIPLYSNIYFDFYTPLLQNYQVSSHISWAQAILDAYWAGGRRQTEKEEYEIIEDFDDFGDDDGLEEFEDDEFMTIDDEDSEEYVTLDDWNDDDFEIIDDF